MQQQSEAVAADVLGQPCLLAFQRERSTQSPFRSNLRLISNFWLHYLAGLFIFHLSEFFSLPVVVPPS